MQQHQRQKLEIISSDTPTKKSTHKWHGVQAPNQTQTPLVALWSSNNSARGSGEH